MKITATFSGDFLNGTSNIDFAVDGPNLTHSEKLVLAQFVKDLGEGKTLVGKNKPSWVDDLHDKIPGTDGYEDDEYWHYHCGPTWIPTTFRCHTVNLNFNPGGKASYECIHYAKTSENTITIVGYSRNHIPFMLSSDKNNPFFSDGDEE